MNTKFEPGHVWKTRDGQDVTIMSICKHTVFGVILNSGYEYMWNVDGSYIATGYIHPKDLVELASAPESKQTLKRRLGRFYVSREFVYSPEMRVLMSHVVVLECRFEFPSERFFYTAYSEMFDYVKEGEIVPFYTPEFRKIGNTTVLSNISRLEGSPE